MSDLLRMGGLVSGTDVQGIIDKLLALRTRRIDVVQDQKVNLESDVAAWMELNSYMSTLSDAAYKLRSINTWNAMSAASSDVTKLSAIASRSAVQSVYTIEFNKLATAHSVASDKFSASTDLVAEGTLTAGHTFAISGDPVGALQTITIGASETLITLASKVNEAALSMDEDHRVFAQIIDGRLVITRSETGATDIQMEDTSGNALASLGILEDDGLGGYAYKNEWVVSQNAFFKINGSGYIERSGNTNLTDVISGVTLNLLSDTGSVKLTIKPDSDSIKEVLFDFITSYNQATAKFKEHIDVDMSDSRNPRTGQLQGDSLARSIPSKLRQLATSIKSSMTSENSSYTYAGKTGVLNNLQTIGIWTSGTGAYGADNTLTVIDEDRLDFMLANYFDEVEQLFMGVAKSGEDGIGKDLYNYAYQVSTSLVGDIDVKIRNLSTQIYDKSELMEKMFDELDSYETRLWRDFSAMENAIARMQQDLTWLVSQSGLVSDKS